MWLAYMYYMLYFYWMAMCEWMCIYRFNTAFQNVVLDHLMAIWNIFEQYFENK